MHVVYDVCILASMHNIHTWCEYDMVFADPKWPP